MGLKNKASVVTGASGGIGAAASLPDAGHRAIRIPMLENNMIREAAATVERDFGRCYVQMNPAGFARMAPHHDLGNVLSKPMRWLRRP